MTPLNRHILANISGLMKQFPVIFLLGARQVGKSTLARMLRPDWKMVDLENVDIQHKIKNDPAFFFAQHDKDIIFDESTLRQHHPLIIFSFVQNA